MFVTSYTYLISPTGERDTSGEMTVFIPRVWPAAMNSRPPSSLRSTPRAERRAASAGTSSAANPAAKIPSPQRSSCAATGPSPAGSSSSNSDTPACTTVRRAPSSGLVSSRTRSAPRMSQNVSAAASRSRTARSIRSRRVSMGRLLCDMRYRRRQHRGDALYNLAQDQSRLFKPPPLPYDGGRFDKEAAHDDDVRHHPARHLRSHRHGHAEPPRQAERPQRRAAGHAARRHPEGGGR